MGVHSKARAVSRLFSEAPATPMPEKRITESEESSPTEAMALREDFSAGYALAVEAPSTPCVSAEALSPPSSPSPPHMYGRNPTPEPQTPLTSRIPTYPALRCPGAPMKPRPAWRGRPTENLRKLCCRLNFEAAGGEVAQVLVM
eukprot:TRINITY_DN14990_c0_g1_i1.p1 TRINITY_DN14990_c0_g1~~TRINITY_DN14990_c0_g1_i1.p1  ORF type:complete len:144 (-),score=16.42 TRINITY_DN14990_c0_g1_i1:1102-1533(-)